MAVNLSELKGPGYRNKNDSSIVEVVFRGCNLWWDQCCDFVYCSLPSACWEELKVSARRRQQELQTAEEYHCFYQDLTEALILIEVLHLPGDPPVQVSLLHLLPTTTGATEEHPRRHSKRLAGTDFTDEETRSSAQ